MANDRKTYGYCPMCMQNVEHTRMFSSTLGFVLDCLTLRILKLFRVGPWYCYQCEGKSYLLQPSRRSAPTFHSEKLKSNFLSPKKEKAIGDPDDSVAAGDRLRSDSRLRRHKKRKSRYSQNFRNATAEKILAGSVTFSQARRELDVKESDLVDWIAYAAQLKGVNVGELKKLFEAVCPGYSEKLPEPSRLTAEAMDTVDADDPPTVVEGHVAPR